MTNNTAEFSLRETTYYYPLCERLQRRFTKPGVGNIAAICRKREIEFRAENIRRAAEPVRATAKPATKKPSEAKAAPEKTIKKEESLATRTVNALTDVIAKKRAEAPKKIIRRSPFPIASLLLTLSFALILTSVVYGAVILNESKRDISERQGEIATLAKDERELELQLETKNDLRVIEDIAVNQIGMVKKDQVTRKYISIYNTDSVELFGGEESTTSRPTLLSALAGGLSGIAEYLD